LMEFILNVKYLRGAPHTHVNNGRGG